ncbi:flagellar brake domain-containing protein [Metabacillus sp. KIGAM252]|uniref:Flagellar brake domain-containing protein n=1 Tax=Metabacillus flavus TaxID=2823519 RepID=A0ABS5LFA8_9BACI|nr:flagellar brake domain-containing protein [Metabacillus flavus]MBS2969433.1 flagellar brake domain-containing protein [Metabacillus flavus]
MLEIGNVITLEPLDQSGDVYKCKIVSMDEGTISIDYPLNESTGKTAFIVNGTLLSCLFVASDQNPYKFDTAVMGRRKENIPVILLKKPENRDVLKIQRRQYVRIDSDVNVAVHSPAEAFEPFVTVTSDLSAGGAGIIIPKHAALNEKEQLIVWMALPLQDGTINYVKVESESVRILEDHSGIRKATIKFMNMNETAQQKIVRYCFDQQILHRKKEAAAE